MVDLSFQRKARIPRKDRGGSVRYTYTVTLWVLAVSEGAALSAGARCYIIHPTVHQ